VRRPSQMEISYSQQEQGDWITKKLERADFLNDNVKLERLYEYEKLKKINGRVEELYCTYSLLLPKGVRIQIDILKYTRLKPTGNRRMSKTNINKVWFRESITTDAYNIVKESAGEKGFTKIYIAEFTILSTDIHKNQHKDLQGAVSEAKDLQKPILSTKHREIGIGVAQLPRCKEKNITFGIFSRIEVPNIRERIRLLLGTNSYSAWGIMVSSHG